VHPPAFLCEINTNTKVPRQRRGDGERGKKKPSPAFAKSAK
jgi:hypothetical protein